MQVTLFSNFTSKPFDYLLISGVTNYTHNRGSLTCLVKLLFSDVKYYILTLKFHANLSPMILLPAIFLVINYEKGKIVKWQSLYLTMETSCYIFGLCTY